MPHLVARAAGDWLPARIDQEASVDIDSLLRPVFGHAKRGASFGHSKIAGRQVLRRGVSPLATTISTGGGADDRRYPVAGRPGPGRWCAASMVREAIRTARAAGATGKVLVRGDFAYGAAFIDVALREGAEFSLVLANSPGVVAAIASIADGPGPCALPRCRHRPRPPVS